MLGFPAGDLKLLNMYWHTYWCGLDWAGLDWTGSCLSVSGNGQNTKNRKTIRHTQVQFAEVRNRKWVQTEQLIRDTVTLNWTMKDQSGTSCRLGSGWGNHRWWRKRKRCFLCCWLLAVFGCLLFVVFFCSFAAERASCASTPAALQSELVSSGPSTHCSPCSSDSLLSSPVSVETNPLSSASMTQNQLNIAELRTPQLVSSLAVEQQRLWKPHRPDWNFVTVHPDGCFLHTGGVPHHDVRPTDPGLAEARRFRL